MLFNIFSAVRYCIQLLNFLIGSLIARVDEERKKAPLTVNMETGNASSKHFDG